MGNACKGVCRNRYFTCTEVNILTRVTLKQSALLSRGVPKPFCVMKKSFSFHVAQCRQCMYIKYDVY